MAIYTLAQQLNADLWPIKIDNIVEHCQQCSSVSSLKQCKKIIESIYFHARKHTSEAERPIIIWFQPSCGYFSGYSTYSEKCIYHYIISMTIANELKKESKNKNIIFVTSEQPLTPEKTEYNSFGDQMRYFSIVELLIPKLDIKGRADLLKHYFSKCELSHEVNIESLEKANLNLIGLQNIVKEAEKVAQKEGATLINEEHVLQAREKCDSSYRYAQEEERKKIAEKLAQEKEEQERIAREREWEEEKKERKKQEEEWEREWEEWKNQRTFTKKIIALGCVCTAGLVYLYNKICSKKDSKESKKKKSNKEKEHTSKEFEYSLNDAYLWHMMNHNNFVMNQ